MKNRTILTTGVLIIISFFTLHAQDFRAGFLAGVCISQIRLSVDGFEGDPPEYTPEANFNINGYMGYKSSGRWGLSIEPGYIAKGALQENAPNDKSDDIRFRFHYVQLSVLADFYIAEKLFASIGPEFALMLKANSIYQDETFDITTNYDNKFEISGLIGINYSVGKMVDLGVRYSHGMTHIASWTFTDVNGTSLGTVKEYNHYFQFLLRAKFHKEA